MRTMRHCQRATPAANAGFTLLETLLSISLSIVLLSSLVILYYGAAKGAARDENVVVADREVRMITDRLSHDFKLIGLMALQDVNGDANDINRDVPGQTWSDSLRQNFEYANTYEVVFTSDFDNDGHTETVRYFFDHATHTIQCKYWRWSRDSLRWLQPRTRIVAHDVDYMTFVFYDKDGATIPNPLTWPIGGYTLSPGERVRATAMEATIVTKAGQIENGQKEPLTMPDGTHFNDKYPRVVSRFLVRGRNFTLGS